ncbi:MAG: hypothetical protein ACREIR_00700, partial [Geminicoccaceae bacterium]
MNPTTSALEPRRDPTAAGPRPWLKPLLFTGLVPKCTFFVTLLLIVFAATQTSLNILVQEGALQAQLHRKGEAMLAMLAQIATRPTIGEHELRELRSIVVELGTREDILY